MRIVDAGVGHVAVCEDGDGERTRVMTDLVGDVSIGDSVLVHAGVALVRLP